jgi:hypothetical protein
MVAMLPAGVSPSAKDATCRAMRPLRTCALLLALPAAAAAAGVPAALPPHPESVATAVWEGPGAALDLRLSGADLTFVLDPGGRRARQVAVLRGATVRAVYGERRRGSGRLVPTSRGAIGLPALDADSLGSVAAVAAGGELRLSNPARAAEPQVIDRGATVRDVSVRPGAVFWTRDGLILRYDVAARRVQQVATVGPAARLDGADGQGSQVVYAFRAGGRAYLVTRQLPSGAQRVLARSTGVLEGPRIARGRVLVRERARYGGGWIDRILSIDLARGGLETLLLRYDGGDGRRFLSPPATDGRRVFVAEVAIRTPVGALALRPTPERLPAGLRSIVRVVPLG